MLFADYVVAYITDLLTHAQSRLATGFLCFCSTSEKAALSASLFVFYRSIYMYLFNRSIQRVKDTHWTLTVVSIGIGVNWDMQKILLSFRSCKVYSFLALLCVSLSLCLVNFSFDAENRRHFVKETCFFSYRLVKGSEASHRQQLKTWNSSYQMVRRDRDLCQRKGHTQFTPTAKTWSIIVFLKRLQAS